jgi:predicted RNA-binding protein YlxR (DUF448 family)
VSPGGKVPGAEGAMVEPTVRPGRRPSRVPQRTCVGCRARAARSVLMRIVAAQAGGGSFIATPDLRRRLPGRGAWLHPSPDCLDLALRRRAFARALRLSGPLDTTALAAALAGRAGPDQDQLTKSEKRKKSKSKKQDAGVDDQAAAIEAAAPFGTGSGLQR